MTRSSPVDIVVRRMDFEIPAIPRYWYDGNPWITHFLNALSTTFPDGERFFIHAVRLFEDQVSDPALRAQIRAFIGQEANHGKEHEAFNQALVAQHGLPLQSKMQFMKSALAWAKKRYQPRHQLALTVGFEHFTAILADLMLREPASLERLDAMYGELFLWHAVEETEHKAVAFDVYQATGGGYWLRVRAMVEATFFFLLIALRMQHSLLKHDGQQGNWRAALGFARFLLVSPGMLTRILPDYLDFYRPGFHPWQHDNRHLIADRVQRLAPMAWKAAQAA